MKTEKGKNKTERFSSNKRLMYSVIVIFAALIILASLLFLIYSNKPSEPKAAIIDQLNSSQLSSSSFFKNETFVNTATQLLLKRFPKVDYFSDNATVDLYKDLASKNYKMIIWRAHSALNLEQRYVAICSSERYSPNKYTQYSNEQLTLCKITGDENSYFAITPKFIEECMNGRFEETVIILMSCNGLKEGYFQTAEAFISKGAKIFISWNGWINSSHNDHAVALLLDYLINKNNNVSEAVSKIQPYLDPNYGLCIMSFYPQENGDYRIPNYLQKASDQNGSTSVLAPFYEGFKRELFPTRSLKVSVVSKQLCRVDFEEHRRLN